MDPKKEKKQPQPEKGEESYYDFWGSYTGTPRDGGAPIQDADDL